MKLTCDEATLICDKGQYKEAPLWEKIKLNLHKFLCKKCGTYSKQNTILTKCYKIHKYSKKSMNGYLCKEEKIYMEKELEAKM